jgi:hypothetical protein
MDKHWVGHLSDIEEKLVRKCMLRKYRVSTNISGQSGDE